MKYQMMAELYSTVLLWIHDWHDLSSLFVFQIFPGLILSDIKPAKKMKFKTVCFLLVQLIHCRKMFKAEIPFSNAMNCEDGDKVWWDTEKHYCDFNG